MLRPNKIATNHRTKSPQITEKPLNRAFEARTFTILKEPHPSMWLFTSNFEFLIPLRPTDFRQSTKNHFLYRVEAFH